MRSIVYNSTQKMRKTKETEKNPKRNKNAKQYEYNTAVHVYVAM